jgi:predicted dienelactone hydrolase
MTALLAARRIFVASALFLTLVSRAIAQVPEASILQPLPLPGPYPVGCSNVTQDFSRVAPGEDVHAYWEGAPRDNGSPRMVTDLLSDPANTLDVTVNAPGDGDVYGSYAGRTLRFVVLVCYPTAANNPYPDYPLPTGASVPHMQSGSQLPILPDATSRFPLLLFSHGYGGSPLDVEYLLPLTVLASYGYIVAAPFHGDFQYNNVALQTFADVVYLIAHLRDFLAMQALRPLTLSATIDLLVDSPQWSARIDPSQIGAFGASMGGESIMLMAGAGLTTSLGLSWSQIENDTRLKMGVSYIPYFGQPIFPAFGRDQRGLEGIALPFMGISGTADTTAPIALTYEGVSLLAGTRELIALTGVTHHFDIPSTNDIFTWTLTFLDAELRGNPASRQKLLQATSVAGGGDDHVVIPYNGSAVPTPNFGGLWWAAPAGSEAGWSLNVAHQGDVIVAAWNTYDVNGNAWWLSMPALKVAPNTYSGTLYETRGSPFDAPFDPSQVMNTTVGTGTLTFSDAGSGTFSYTANGVTQTKPITKFVFASPVPVCTFGSSIPPVQATNYQGLWWGAPGSETGWSLSLTHQDGAIVVDWFTHDASERPTWLSAALFNASGTTYAGTLVASTGPPFNSVPFDPRKVALSTVGTASLTFADGNNAAFTYTVGGVTQVKQITRFVFVAPGTICQ